MSTKPLTPGQAKALRIEVANAEAEGYRKGWLAGQAAAKEHLQNPDLVRATLEAKIKLINAVGQTMGVQANLLSGLGQVFDCGPR